MLTSGYVAQDLEQRLGPGVPVYQPADHCVEKNDKCRSQRVQEKEEALVSRDLLGQEREGDADGVEQEKRRQAHGSIKLRFRQILERVDNDHVRCVAGVKQAAGAQHGGNLAGRNVDGRTGHEGGQRDERDEIDNPAGTDQANKGDDGSSNNGQRTSNSPRLDFRVGLADIEDNVADERGHDSDGLVCEGQLANPENAPGAHQTYTNRDILGSSEEPVDQDTHE